MNKKGPPWNREFYFNSESNYSWKTLKLTYWQCVHPQISIKHFDGRIKVHCTRHTTSDTDGRLQTISIQS